jgi:4-hydroxythreonine-4-phosphate dehydrogenase
MPKPIIAITMGDPAGIGPEIIIKALAYDEVRESARFLIFGDANIIHREARNLDFRIPLIPISSVTDAEFPANGIEILNLTALNPTLEYGMPTAASGDAAFKYIKSAALSALDGKVGAVVTAPISKEALNMAGHKYPGHTEILAELCSTNDYAMMLAGPHLKVVLCTIHVPYTKVPSLLSKGLILKTIRITHESFSKYLGKRPRIAVAALNPHAGEGGMFGGEEAEHIHPAVEEALSRGMNVSGPHPPDTLFHYAAKGKYDAVVCMYHDQGLIPMKLLDFECGVNVTLGLPIIRTSVDHGTAFDIAGKGIANPSSMVEAIRMAVEMAERQ